MSKTALQIVNEVEVRLRETESTDFSNSYTKLLLALVNEAYQEVQAAHQWEANSHEIRFTTVASQLEYDLTDDTNGTGDADVGYGLANERTQLQYNIDQATGLQQPMLWDVQDSPTNYRLDVWNKRQGQYETYKNPEAAGFSGIPLRVKIGVDANSSTFKVTYLDTPDAARAIRGQFYIPKEDVAATTDIIYIPHQPIVLGAYWRALEERGEELGPQGALAQRSYLSSLDAHILTDIGDEVYNAVPQ